jgi:hypothetical protein
VGKKSIGNKGKVWGNQGTVILEPRY